LKLIAQKYNIVLLQPEKIGDCELEIKKLLPDLIIVAAYGQLIPKSILNIPRHGCLNVHPSLLPKYRGASPIQTTILNGEDETGVTIILMDEKMDHGPIVSKINFQSPISKMTSIDLSKELANLGANLLIEVVPKWTAEEIKAQTQDESKATYTKILNKVDGRIDWNKSAPEIERQIRAYYPWPGTYAFMKDSQDKIRKIELLDANVLLQTEFGPYGPAGKTFWGSNDKIAVQTGKDFLIIKELKPEGRNRMSAGDFMKGHQNFIGTIFE